MQEKARAKNNRLLILILLALLLVIALLAGILFFVLRGNGETVTIGDGEPILAYAEGVTVVEDPDALQRAVDEMMSADSDGIVLEYKEGASSTDGKNFSCYIANAVENRYDMYFQIFSDIELTDQLLLTGLVRPGNAFDNITLEKTLPRGSHTVYLVLTQVEEDLATIHGQIVVTMEFTVS